MFCGELSNFALGSLLLVAILEDGHLYHTVTPTRCALTWILVFRG